MKKSYILTVILAILIIATVVQSNILAKEEIKTLEKSIETMTQEITVLENEIQELLKTKQELEKQNKQLKKKPKPIQVSRGVPSHRNFKSYMDYRTITATGSKQYQLQQQAYTDNQGLRKIGERYLVAVGSGFGKVGDNITVTMGQTVIPCKIGDQKANHHTDASNKIHISDGSIIEFIVDVNTLNRQAKQMGDCSYIPEPNLKAPVSKITLDK